jgi:hypothetical protein
VADQPASILVCTNLVTDTVRFSFHTCGGDLIADHLGWRIDYCQRACDAQYWPKSLNG